MPTSLAPLLAGAWNAHSLWLQWTPQPGATRYRVEIQVDGGAWRLIDAGQTQRHWMILPLWKAGATVRARVAVPGSDPEPARECVFRRSRCVFGFQAGRPALRYPQGTSFHALVDGLGCSYQTEQDIELGAGELAEATLVAQCSGGFAQLDAPGDFDLHPAPGERIWNLRPSENDCELTGRDWTVLAAVKRDGPVALIKLPRNPCVR